MRLFVFIVYTICVLLSGWQVEFGALAYSKLNLSPCYNQALP